MFDTLELPLDWVDRISGLRGCLDHSGKRYRQIEAATNGGRMQENSQTCRRFVHAGKYAGTRSPLVRGVQRAPSFLVLLEKNRPRVWLDISARIGSVHGFLLRTPDLSLIKHSTV
jgi:hypothetical protein